GYGFFAENLVDTMLRLEPGISFVLFYRTSKWVGRFSSFKNVKEIQVWAPHKLAWDQVAVPYRAWVEKADVILNPKFTVPLFSRCPVTMCLMEPAWWAWPEHYEWWDVKYMKLMLPLYLRKAAHLFPWCNFHVEEMRKYLRLPLNNFTITPPAPRNEFRVIEDA